MAHAVQVPVSVKMPMRLTNVLAAGDALHGCGVRAGALQPLFRTDVDIERMDFVESSPYSDASEIRNVLRTTGYARPNCRSSTSPYRRACTTAPPWSRRCSAAPAQRRCARIHLHGFEVIGVNRFVDEWAARHGFASIEDFRGR